MIAYTPLLNKIPKPTVKKLELKELTLYDQMSAVEYTRLPLEERFELNQRRKEAGLKAINHGWGDYDGQRPFLGELHTRAPTDFAFLKSLLGE